MASKIKCKSCNTLNDKYNVACASCGKPLYKEVSYKTALNVTVVFDVLFIIVYILGIFIFISKYNSEEFNPFIMYLPVKNTLLYFLIIVFFALSAIIRILFLLNVFFFKKNMPYHIRRTIMFVECVTMFPLQLILSMYFYGIATDLNKK